MHCISTVSYSIIINGNPFVSFSLSRGLRQGDPLSPYLYLCIANILPNMLDGAIRSSGIKGFKINNRCPTISASLFTDDTIIFAQASLLEAHRLNILLD